MSQSNLIARLKLRADAATTARRLANELNAIADSIGDGGYPDGPSILDSGSLASLIEHCVAMRVMRDAVLNGDVKP